MNCNYKILPILYEKDHRTKITFLPMALEQMTTKKSLLKKKVIYDALFANDKSQKKDF